MNGVKRSQKNGNHFWRSVDSFVLISNYSLFMPTILLWKSWGHVHLKCYCSLSSWNIVEKGEGDQPGFPPIRAFVVGGVDAFVDAAPNVDAAPTAGQVLHASTPDRGKGFILPSQTESQTVMQIHSENTIGRIYVCRKSGIQNIWLKDCFLHRNTVLFKWALFRISCDSL